MATSVTGFFLPVQHFMPSHAVGILSLLVLAAAIYARYARHLTGAWRKVYVIGAVLGLYLNIFVAIVQAFLKIAPLKELAPTQLLVLVLFVVLAIAAAIKFPNEPARATSSRPSDPVFG